MNKQIKLITKALYCRLGVSAALSASLLHRAEGLPALRPSGICVVKLRLRRAAGGPPARLGFPRTGSGVSPDGRRQTK